MTRWPLSPLIPLLLLLGAFALAACGPDLGPGPGGDDDDDDDDWGDDDDDDDDAAVEPIIIGVQPEPDAVDVAVNGELWVQFDVAPDEVTLSLAGPEGAVALAVEVEDDGVLHVATPDSDLVGESPYTFTIEWSPSSFGAVDIDFTTAAVATPDEMEAAIGVTYATNLITGTFVEPAGVGGIIKAQLDDIPLMMSVRPESEFAPDAQPGFHMIGAVGHYDDFGNVLQGDCGTSIAMTAGPDLEYGTADDIPGTFTSPEFIVRPAVLEASAQGITLELTDLVISGNFPPSLVHISDISISGSADTRPLDVLLGDGEGAICDLLNKTADLDCYECGSGNPGPFCMDIVVEDLTATLEADPVVERNCDDVIALFESGAGCGTEAIAYDEDNNGTYELCPQYAP